MLELSSLRKISSHKGFNQAPLRKNKRIMHIRSVPSQPNDYQLAVGISKIENPRVQATQRQDSELKLRKFKSQQLLKTPLFAAVQTARDRHLIQWTKKPRQFLLKSNKSLTRSTNYRSPATQKESTVQKSFNRADKSKSRKQTSFNKQYTAMLKRVKSVVEEYQLKLKKNAAQKQSLAKQNDVLRRQLDSLQRRVK